MLRFQWDSSKAANVAKYGVSFEEAATAFADPLSLTIADPDHSSQEERFVLIGVAEEMRPEYDFPQGERGRYARRFAEGANIVVLDPDVARLFPDSSSVNRVLRMLAEIARREIADSSSS